MFKKIMLLTISLIFIINISCNTMTTMASTEYSVDSSEAMMMDMIRPEITLFELDKYRATVGETVKVSLQFKDNGANIEYVDIRLKIDDIDLSIYDTMIYNQDTKCYEYYLYIDKSMPSGSGKFYININDGYCSETRYIDSMLDIYDTDLTITDLIPKVKNIKFDKVNYSLGEVINVKVEIEKMKANVKNSYLVLKNLESDYAIEYINLNYDSVEDAYKGSIVVTDNLFNGDWAAVKLGMNTDYILKNYPISSTAITITSTSQIVPKVKEIKIENNNITAGRFVKYQIEIEADVMFSQVFGYLTLKENTNISQYCAFEYNKDSKLYETEVYLNSNIPTGTYSLTGVYGFTTQNFRIKDISTKNTINNNIEIKGNDNVDITEPIFKSISTSNKIATTGDTVKISVDAEDKESGIASVSLGYSKGAIAQEYIDITLNYNPKTGLYEKEFDVNDYFTNGEWKLTQIEITNNELNLHVKSKIYIDSTSYDLTEGNFTIISKEETNPIPVSIDKIWIDKDYIIPGEKTKLYLDISGDKNLIASIKINMNDGLLIPKVSESHIIYNNDTGFYECEFIVPSNTKNSYFNIYLSAWIQTFSGENESKEHGIISCNSFDVNEDNKLNIVDLASLATKYNTSSDLASRYDLNRDGIIDVYDMVMLSKAL